MKNWLITGGAGFIGSNFVRKACRDFKNNLIILDKLTYAGNLASIRDLLSLPNVKFIRGDINDENLIKDIFQKYQISRLIHFAAESHVDRSILGPKEFIRTNIEGTFTLLEVVRRIWKTNEDNLFLHVSTDEVYGTLSLDAPPFNENLPYQPNSPYSASKAASDHLVRAWHHTYGLPTIITHCSNNYGPWQFPEKLIPLIILNALEGKELPIYGDGLQIRDWLHVDDHCNALLSIIEKGRIGEVYNIGGNNEKTNLELVQSICDVVDAYMGEPRGKSRELIRHVTDRPGHDRRYAIDSSKLKHQTGWYPLHKIEEDLINLVKWYIDHKEWANNIRSKEYLNFYERQYGDK